jgi:hypothetical protein
MCYKHVDNDYEIFIINKDYNQLLSLDKNNVYFFNTTNFTDKDFEDLKNNNFESLINNRLALRFDTEMIYRMYLGFVNKNRCHECQKLLGDLENNKGFGSLTV